MKKLFIWKKPKPNSEAFGLKFKDNDYHKSLLLLTAEKQFKVIQEKFVKLVKSPELITLQNIEAIKRHLNNMIIQTKTIEETTEYLGKHSNLPADGRRFALRLRIEKFLTVIFNYRLLLDHWSPYPAAMEYFKYEPSIQNGYIYDMILKLNTFEILDNYKSIYEMKLENGEIEDAN